MIKLYDMPQAVPVEHQALSFGSLGTPNRNLNCHKCESTGKIIRWDHGVAFREEPCERCGGKGELSFKGERLLAH